MGNPNLLALQLLLLRPDTHRRGKINISSRIIDIDN